MDLRHSFHLMDAKQIVLLLLAIILSITSGAFALVYDANFSPLIVGVAVAILTVVVVLLGNPLLALYAAIFVAFLPYVYSQSSYSHLIDLMQSYLSRLFTITVASDFKS